MAKRFFGLDIGNHSIKAIMLSGSADKPKLAGYAYGSTPSGILVSEDEESQKRLASSIKDIIKSSNLSRVKGVVFAIPESHVFKRLLTNLPYVNDDTLNSTIVWEVKKYLTTSVDEMTIDYIFIGEKNKDGMRVADVLAVAVKNQFIQRYIKVLELAGLEPVGAETEGIASVRALYPMVRDLSTSYLVVDFGSASTDVSVAYKDKLVYSDSISYGSDSITKAIAQTFSMDNTKAEEYKKTYGLDKNHFEGKLHEVVAPVVDMILVDVRRSLEYFKREFPEIAPAKILITGEAANMPGLMQYAGEKLGISVEIANAWTNIDVSGEDSQFLGKIASAFTVAVGLANKQDI